VLPKLWAHIPLDATTSQKDATACGTQAVSLLTDSVGVARLVLGFRSCPFDVLAQVGYACPTKAAKIHRCLILAKEYLFYVRFFHAENPVLRSRLFLYSIDNYYILMYNIAYEKSITG
jgi:hypothetical protein